jgi:tRNA U54 and U55 pseudouridine synthase Pus10
MQQDLEGLWLRERVCGRCWGWAHDAWEEGLEDREKGVVVNWLVESELQTTSKTLDGHELARYLADFMMQWGGDLDDHEDCGDLLCLCGCRVYRDKEGD